MDFASIGSIVAAMMAMFGFFWSRLDRRFDQIDQKFDKIDQRLDRIENDIKELRTSLNRMEGAFYSKDCCMLKEDRTERTK